MSLGGIDAVELVKVELPLLAPFETSFGTLSTKTALLVRLEADGITAWGDCVADADPYYSYETIDAAATSSRTSCMSSCAPARPWAR